MASTDYTGQTLDERYHVDRLVGQGGMGRVYAGRHARVGRKVAIKVLAGELAGNDEIVLRFFQEARAAAAIGHRNIIDVIDVGVTADSDPYLVMEYLEGESLAGLIARSGPLDLATACGIVEPVLRALAAAHKAGIVHRDLKPENVFLSYPEDGNPEVKLIDFGISKVTTQAQGTRLTDTGQLLGTPAYMAPEQAEDAADVDERTDIYAVGVLLYELLTGALPFEGANNLKLLAKVLRGNPTPPKKANPSFPDAAEGLVLRAMARKPADRFQSAAEMLDALRTLEGYSERHENLRRLATGAFKTTLPQGALGDEISSEDASADAKAMLAEIVERSTPSKRAPATERSGSFRLAGYAAAGLVVLAGGYLALRRASTKAASIEPVPTASSASPSTGQSPIEIRVHGVPAGAKIFYDHARVDENPFRVRASEALVPLRVVAEGYQDYAVSVTPDRSQTVQVDLTPIAAQAVPAPSASVSPTARAGPHRPPVTPKASPSVKTPDGFRHEFE